MDAPAENYDEYTVKEAKAAVRDGDLDPAAALAYEREHKDRVTLTRWLEDRIEAQEETRPEMVPVANQRPGHVAGIHFERAHETRVVERTVRVEEAITKGDLRVLDHEP